MGVVMDTGSRQEGVRTRRARSRCAFPSTDDDLVQWISFRLFFHRRCFAVRLTSHRKACRLAQDRAGRLIIINATAAAAFNARSCSPERIFEKKM